MERRTEPSTNKLLADASDLSPDKQCMHLSVHHAAPTPGLSQMRATLRPRQYPSICVPMVIYVCKICITKCFSNLFLARNLYITKAREKPTHLPLPGRDCRTRAQSPGQRSQSHRAHSSPCPHQGAWPAWQETTQPPRHPILPALVPQSPGQMSVSTSHSGLLVAPKAPLSPREGARDKAIQLSLEGGYQNISPVRSDFPASPLVH